MTRNRTEFHLPRARFVLWITLALVLAACASVPPPTDRLNRAQAGIDAAVDAGAHAWAPLELGFAQDKLNQARAAVADHDNAKAADLAAESLANSALAQMKSKLGKLREDNKKAQAENNRLRRNLLAAPASGNAGGGA